MDQDHALRLTDTGNAKQFAEDHNEIVRFVPEWKSWAVWTDGTRWSRDAERFVNRLAVVTVERMAQGAIKHIGRAEEALAPLKPLLPRMKKLTREATAGTLTKTELKELQRFQKKIEPVEADYAQGKAALMWAQRSASAERLSAMLGRARHEQLVETSQEQFDDNKWLLNVANGTTDLRTGKLRKHKREDFITQISPVEYDPKAKHPVWDEFLDRMIPDKELRRYIQKVAGYMLTGSTDEQLLFLPFGRGSSGKGTITMAFMAALGSEYATSTDFKTFLEGDASRFEMWHHVRSRLVTAQEVSKKARFDTALMRRITGQDPVQAERKYCDSFMFMPVWKLWLVGNSQPQIDPDEEAMWRRVRVIPFNVALPRVERNPAVRNTLSTDPRALQAVLVWMVQGCLLYQKEGLKEPAAVLTATEVYRNASDNFGRWFETHMALDPEGAVTSKVLWASYMDHCEHRTEAPLTRDEFHERLKARGCTRTTIGHAKDRGWKGLSVLPVEEPEYDSVRSVEAFLDAIEAQKFEEEQEYDGDAQAALAVEAASLAEEAAIEAEAEVTRRAVLGGLGLID